MRVNLTDEELFICRTLGVMRRSVAMKNVKDQQVGRDCVWSIDIDGVVAEYCVAKMLNVCVDLSVSPRKKMKKRKSFLRKTKKRKRKNASSV